MAENHCNSSFEACSETASVGTATLRMVASSPMVSMANASAPSAHHRLLSRLTAPSGTGRVEVDMAAPISCEDVVYDGISQVRVSVKFFVRKNGLVAVVGFWGWREVEGGVAVEEAEGFEPERHGVGRHHRPILGPGDVMDAEDVPKHDVGILQRLVVLDPGRDPGIVLALRRIGAARPLLVVLVPGHPE